MKDIVVSVYDEEITWLKQRNFSNEKIFAYKKFERFDYDFVTLLPNVGRESHTYIWHMLNNYNSTNSDYTVFLQGDPFPHLINKTDSIPYRIFNNSYNFTHHYYPLGELVVCDGFGRPLSKWECELYRIWDELFAADMPLYFIANFGAQHVVHNSVWKSRSKKFWQRALELHYELDHTPWAFEIIWSYVLDPRFIARI